MNNLLKMQQKLIPQVLDIMTRRYSILREIYLNETIGRRSFANMLGLVKELFVQKQKF